MRVILEYGKEAISKTVDALTAWKVLQLLGLIDSEAPPLTLGEVERMHIERVLDDRPELSFQEIADELGIAKKTLWAKRRKYGRPTLDKGQRRTSAKDRESVPRKEETWEVSKVSREDAEKEIEELKSRK